MNKRKNIMTGFMVVAFAVLFAACDPIEGSIDEVLVKAGGGEPHFTVTFNSTGGSSVKSQRVKEGNTVSQPTDPKKADHKFFRWCLDAAGDSIYNFDAPVTQDITLYADWVDQNAAFCIVTFDSNGGTDVTYQEVYQGKKVMRPTDPFNR